MAEQEKVPAGWDGRFGDTFGAEISTKSLLQIALALVLMCLLGIVLAWGVLNFLEGRRQPTTASPLLAVEHLARLSGPLLQPKPEAEMAALWQEMAFHLGAPVGPKKPLANSGAGWGWVDQAAGVVHMPIYEAMDLLLEQQASLRLEPPANAVGEHAEPVAVEPPNDE